MAAFRAGRILKGCLSIKCLQFSTILLQLRPIKRSICLRSSSLSSNPLIVNVTDFKFREVTADNVEEGIPLIISQVENDFQEFESKLASSLKNNETMTWEATLDPLESIPDKLNVAWGIVTHLHNVKNSENLRTAYSKVHPQVIQLNTKIGQSKPIYEALKQLQNDKDLGEIEKRIISSGIQGAYHSGVSLERENKTRFNAIIQELADLSTTFSNNVLDSTKEFGLLIENPDDVKGLPKTLLHLIAGSAAKDLNKTTDIVNGPWKLTLDMPCYDPFMKHSQNRDLRQKMYLAYISRASNGKLDNSEIIEKIRRLRQEVSALLGFENYASLSLDMKMAKEPKAVLSMIESLRSKSKEKAIEEFNQLQDYATKNGFSGNLLHWDLSYWAERQREELFSLKEEELRPYFPLPRVLQGLFLLADELFGIDIKLADGEAETWNDDVRFFKIFSKTGQHLASFFLDPYSRPAEKRGGAWMDSALDRSKLLNRTPIAYLVCNQSPPLNGSPSLMNFREVETLFHEFGHGLQHMLTTVNYSAAAGVNNIEWDAVELPSQFMENWLYDWETVKLISSHYKTAETLPRPIFDQLIKSRKYTAALGMLRQLYFSALDMELHQSNDSWMNVMKKVSAEYTILRPHPDDRFPCSFLHIFAGGYSAGYYSYKWAEVMAADAFSAFEEVGLENRTAISRIGKRFRDTILACGGGRQPSKVFEDFRGRQPNVAAILSLYGLQ